MSSPDQPTSTTSSPSSPGNKVETPSSEQQVTESDAKTPLSEQQVPIIPAEAILSAEEDDVGEQGQTLNGEGEVNDHENIQVDYNEDFASSSSSGLIKSPDPHLVSQQITQDITDATAFLSPGIATKPRKQRAAPIGGKWSEEEDKALTAIVTERGPKNWKEISKLLGPMRTDVQCLHRWNKVLKPGLHKGPWKEEEDSIVRDTVMRHGVGKVKWSAIAALLPGRIGKQCRERWFNHLDPTIKKGEWSADEDRVLYEAQKQFGNRWCEILKILPGRTENSLKNRWNSSTMKKWLKENNLEPGNGDPVHDLTQGDANYLLAVFSQALVDSGIVSNIDTSLLEAKEREAEEKVEERDEDDDDFPDGQVDYLEHDLDLIDAELVTNSDGSQELRVPTPSSSSAAAASKPGYMAKMPAHLKPAMIDTSPRENDSVEKTTEGILAMLHNLKNTPSPKYNDKDKSTDGTNKRVRKRKVDPDFQEPTRGGASGNKGKKKQRFANLTVNNDNACNSPTSKALYALQNALDQQKSSSSSSSSAPLSVVTEFSKVPLTLLPYFMHLNENAKKNLLQQLIQRFQSSSITPRNANINTPRWNHGGVLGLGVGIGINGPETPRFDEPINPDCFADHERSMLGLSPIAATTSEGKTNALDDFMGDVDDKRTSKFKGMRLSSPSSATANGTKSQSPSQASVSIAPPSSISHEESAIEIAVVIALQIISRSSTADKLLQMLISSDTSVPNFPPSTKNSLSLGIMTGEFPVPVAPPLSIRSKESPASKELDNLIAQVVRGTVGLDRTSSADNLMFAEGYENEVDVVAEHQTQGSTST